MTLPTIKVVLKTCKYKQNLALDQCEIKHLILFFYRLFGMQVFFGGDKLCNNTE